MQKKDAIYIKQRPYLQNNYVLGFFLAIYTKITQSICTKFPQSIFRSRQDPVERHLIQFQHTEEPVFHLDRIFIIHTFPPLYYFIFRFYVSHYKTSFHIIYGGIYHEIHQ